MRILALVWPTLRSLADPEELAAAAPPFGAILDRLDDLSPRIEPVALGVALLDVTGLEPLFGDERRIAARAATIARGVAPLPLRAGAGDNRWLATLAARLARPSRADAPAVFRPIPPGEGAATLAELPLSLLPADSATRQRFALFGLTRMGELARLPRSAVVAQLGPAGERLSALARGEDPRPLVPRRRPERVAAKLALDPPAQGLAEITLGLRRCCAELCDRLRARHLAPGRATLDLGLEDRPPLRVTLAFPEPALDPDWIARLLLGRLEAVLPRDGGEHESRIEAISVRLDRLGDPSARQLPAFEPQAARWEELRWSTERMAARFGPGRLWRAVNERPSATLPERRAGLVEIGAAVEHG